MSEKFVFFLLKRVVLFNVRNISEGEEYDFCDQQPCHVLNDYFNM